jgi:8-oxo-dGTP pyrophosphatase MutT (NUDIX family)
MALFQNKIYCNNCGKPGHMYHHCKMPILSIGTIVFRVIGKETEETEETGIIDNPRKEIQYLMICRNTTYGFMDFIRGKYSIYNKDFLLNLFREMSISEKNMIETHDFKYLWNQLWNNKPVQSQYKQEEQQSEEKFNSLKTGIIFQNDFYSLETILEECKNNSLWDEPEWGFPKGRRNHFERDYDCALREFREETGYPINSLRNIENIMPIEEIFTGSNYKSYKNKYYLMKMVNESKDIKEIKEENKIVQHFDKSEVSKMEWKTYEECMKCIRPYNLEKRQILTNINNALLKYKLS